MTATTYQVEVQTITRWATGMRRGSAYRTVEVVEEATIMGGLRAINQAVESLRHYADPDGSPRITPNPAELDWPLS